MRMIQAIAAFVTSQTRVVQGDFIGQLLTRRVERHMLAKYAKMASDMCCHT